MLSEIQPTVTGPNSTGIRVQPQCNPVVPESVRNALEAVLLFYRYGPSDDVVRIRWTQLTGSNEATSRTLCDAVRRALKEIQPTA